MGIENFSYQDKGIDRFDGKHHIIADIALSGLFEDEDDVRSAFSETIAE